MAGAGYKLFSTGDVLTASEVNTYLMQQTVMSFASAAARTSALSAVLAEGLVSYLQDTNVVEIYTGAAWVSLDDPNAIQNTLLTTTGDTIYASGANTPARLGVGTTGQVLTVAAGVPAWSTISSGAMTLLSTTTLSGASTTISSISQSYNQLYAVIAGVSIQTTAGIISCAFNGANNGNYTIVTSRQSPTVTWNQGVAVGLSARLAAKISNATNNWVVQIDNYSSSTQYKPVQWWGNPFLDVANDYTPVIGYGTENSNTATSSIVFNVSAGTFSAGTVYLYGVK